MKILEKHTFNEVKVSYKVSKKHCDLDSISNSRTTYDYLRRVWDKGTINYTEDFIILLLNRTNKIIGWSKVSSGGMAGVLCDPKVIFSIALAAGAHSIILSHNHPSGNTKPSNEDLNMTQKLKGGGELLDIDVLDHIIITDDTYLSFADEGLI